MKQMNGAANKALVAIGGILVIVGTFLPWADIAGITLTGLNLTYLAWLVLAFGIVGMVLGLWGTKWGYVGTTSLGLAGFVLLALNTFLVWGVGLGTVLGYGIYTTMAGTLVLVFGGIWGYIWAKGQAAEYPTAPEPTPTD